MISIPKIPSPANRPTEYLFLVVAFAFGIMRRYISLPLNLEADLQMGLALLVPGITWLVEARRRWELRQLDRLTEAQKRKLAGLSP